MFDFQFFVKLRKSFCSPFKFVLNFECSGLMCREHFKNLKSLANLRLQGLIVLQFLFMYYGDYEFYLQIYEFNESTNFDTIIIRKFVKSVNL